ncbi:MAG: A/G-specific adenine glycosylase [Bacteroidia bacterium]|nr:A/G-specific adenine glycosylase [Bacteroidia bacterium]
MDKRYFSEKVVEWYEEHRRELPWRHTTDPYNIWLSEVILQQTRVNQGLPYYLRFIEAFPTVGALAAAEEQQVLRLWQGLGYYSRARNLLKCARQVVKDFQCRFPTDYNSLKSLPGIGEYTAAAIASIAYNEPVAVVDGNVYRVMSRYFGLSDDITTLNAKRNFASLANELVLTQPPATYNQAVMEFGAMVCTPASPGCDDCGLNTHCFAFRQGMQNSLPVKGRKTKTRKRYFYYLVVQKGHGCLMRERASGDIWQGLYDFPVIEKTGVVSLKKLATELPELAGREIDISPIYKHVLTHQTIFARFIALRSRNGHGLGFDGRFYTRTQIAELPKPVLISRYLADANLL